MAYWIALKVYLQCYQFPLIRQLHPCRVLVPHYIYHLVADRYYYHCVHGNHSLIRGPPDHLSARLAADILLFLHMWCHIFPEVPHQYLFPLLYSQAPHPFLQYWYHYLQQG